MPGCGRTANGTSGRWGRKGGATDEPGRSTRPQGRADPGWGGTGEPLYRPAVVIRRQDPDLRVKGKEIRSPGSVRSILTDPGGATREVREGFSSITEFPPAFRRLSELFLVP